MGRSGLTRRELVLAAVAAGLLGPRRALAQTPVATAEPAAPPSRPGEGAWPLPAHDLEATRRARSALPAAGVRWRAQLAGGSPGAAALVRGRAYAASLGGVVGAFRLADGETLWVRSLPVAVYGEGGSRRELGFFGGVATDGRRLVVASDRVFCLDAERGATLWETSPLRTGTSDDYFWGPPVIAAGLVLVGSGSGAELPTARGRVTAYALADGRLVWSTPMVPEGANGGGVIGPVSVDPGRRAVYVATGSPYEAVPGDNPGTCSVGELDLRDGEIRWLDQVYAGDRRGFDFNSAPVLVGRLAVAANKDGFYAWDRTRRERVWHRRLTPSIPPGGDVADPTSGPEGGPIATDGRRVYVLSNDAAQEGCVVAALEARDGSVRWQRSLPAFSFAAPALVGGLLCVPSADGFLRALSAADGSIRSTTSLGAPSSAPPSAAAGVLVVGTGAEPFLPGDELVCVGAGRPGPHRFA